MVSIYHVKSLLFFFCFFFSGRHWAQRLKRNQNNLFLLLITSMHCSVRLSHSPPKTLSASAPPSLLHSESCKRSPFSPLNLSVCCPRLCSSAGCSQRSPLTFIWSKSCFYLLLWTQMLLNPNPALKMVVSYYGYWRMYYNREDLSWFIGSGAIRWYQYRHYSNVDIVSKMVNSSRKKRDI